MRLDVGHGAHGGARLVVRALARPGQGSLPVDAGQGERGQEAKALCINLVQIWSVFVGRSELVKLVLCDVEWIYML